MERIGVRELRQHASRYLARVRAGETIEVTDRGRPVARLVPVPERTRTLQDLIDAGIVIPAEREPIDWATWKPLPSRPGERPASEHVLEEREEDR
jgi:prevent-host-death family protein